jgi:FkbM family methyltransferase
MANPLLSLASAAARWLPAPLKRGLYRLGPLSGGLRSALNQAAPEGLSQVEVAGGGLAGAKMLLDLHSEKDYWLGTYELDLQKAIRDWVQPGMVVYDLGANVGYLSLLLARQVGAGGKVIAFEPLPANQERLLANLRLNPELNVELIAKAVGNGSGRMAFNLHASDDMGKLEGSVGRQIEYADSIQVETVSLDDFVYREHNPVPGLIKIDTEGGEVLALAGMKRLSAEAQALLLIELHGPEAARAVWEALSGANYSLHRLGKGYPVVKSVDALDWKSYVLGRPPV